MNLCLICLRTDRLLKVASNVLEEFHNELCDMSVANMTSSFHYCSECEYLLTKFYKFKQKCMKALKIYQKWMSSKANKQTISHLYSLLPPSPLGMWGPHPDKISNLYLRETESPPDLCIKDELTKDTRTNEVKIENDLSHSSDNIEKFPDVLKTEYISKNVPKSEHNDEIKNDSKEEYSVFDNVEEIEYSEEYTTKKHNTENSDKKTKPLTTKKPSNKKNNEKIIKSKKRVSKNINTKKNAQHDKVIENDKMYESVFDIEYLRTHEMKVEEFQRRKTYECYVNAEHKCEICYQVVKSSKFLEYHTSNWHNESAGRICCPICKIWYSKSSHHKLTHIAVFKCKRCSLVTYRRESMQNHFEQHEGKQYHCEECDVTCKSKSVYRAHMGRVHRLGRNVCERCGRGFRSPLGLSIHKNNSARCTLLKEPSAVSKENTEGVRCDECDVTLPSQQVYDTHVADVHKSSREVSLPLATNSAALPEPRIRKPRKYIRRTPVKHICRVCNKVGPSFGWLQLHFKREHPNEDINLLYADKKTHLCDICGTGFSNVYALRSHMNLHTGARPHACDICPKRFRSANIMREHRLRHFPSAMPCTHCGKQFKSRANLYIHMKTHTGERDYKCDLCGKAFLHSSALKEHVRGVHYNIRRVKRGGTREGAADTGAGKRTKREKRITAEEETDYDFGSDGSE